VDGQKVGLGSTARAAGAISTTPDHAFGSGTGFVVVQRVGVEARSVGWDPNSRTDKGTPYTAKRSTESDSHEGWRRPLRSTGQGSLQPTVGDPASAGGLD